MNDRLSTRATNKMITYFNQRQLIFAEAISSIAHEIKVRPLSRAHHSEFVLALADMLLERAVGRDERAKSDTCDVLTDACASRGARYADTSGDSL